MVLDASLINLILYCMQQLGVALGVGAQTVMLLGFMRATRDGVVDDTEAQFLRATRGVLVLSLILITLSGIVITAMHVMAGQGATILTSAYLFKWLIIAVIIALSALVQVVPETFAEALLAANWYALFVVHILAPITTWTNLLELWAVWVVGFCLCWYAAVLMSRHHKGKVMQPKPLFTLFKKKDTPPVAAINEPTPPKPVPQVETPKAAPIAVPIAAPKEMPKIVLDPAPKAPPLVMASQVGMPIVVNIPAGKAFLPPVSEVKAPANITTDTPFLPQVPPLQPIPVIPASTAATSTTAPTTIPAPANAPAANPAPAATPLGLTVMPKNPEQMPK